MAHHSVGDNFCFRHDYIRIDSRVGNSAAVLPAILLFRAVPSETALLGPAAIS